MFKDVPNFKVICCGGDGTVGWVLEAMGKSQNMLMHFVLRCHDIDHLITLVFCSDSVQMQSQPAVGVIPLGTGNDLARCLRWGGGYEGESVQKVMHKMSAATKVWLDRWSIEVTNHAPAEQRSQMTRSAASKVCWRA